MTRTFIEVPLFTKRWKEIGLDDNDLHSLQIMLLKDPESGPVMEGTGGIRKVRFPLENKGKAEVYVSVIQILQNMKCFILLQRLKKRSRKIFLQKKKMCLENW